MSKRAIRWIVSLSALILLSWASVPETWCADIESHSYLKTLGNKQLEIQWCVEKSENTRMLWKTSEEYSLIETKGPFATTRWQGANETEDTSIVALRNGDSITIQGVFKGEPIDRTTSIDAAPWFQSMSWSLRSLILCDDAQMEFWTLRPDTMKAYKLVAKKIQKEALQVGGKTLSAIKIEVRPSGILSPFWHSYYWFRETDGVWLGSKSPSGPPGKPHITIEYRRPSQACTISAEIPSPRQLSNGSHDTHDQTGG